MKKNITTLLIGCMIPIISIAQPTLTKNEFYHIGDIINMTRCDATSINAGVGGAAVSWDFSGVSASGGIATTTVAANTSSDFLTSNIMITLPNGNTQFVQESSTDSYIDGMVDHGVTTQYNHFDYSRRPVTYNTNYTDTYKVTIVASGTTGTGVVTQTGDGYGSLKLPTGTFPYVLRVKRHITEIDSVSGLQSAFFTTTTYMWFDTVHTAPLFRIDSGSDVTGSTVSAMYLAAPTAVKNVSNDNSKYSGFIADNKLQIIGNFESGKDYDLALYNVIGVKVLSQRFTGNKNVQQFPLSAQLTPGIYIADVADVNAPAERAVIKVIKQ
ncbi:MAG: Por secretion system C-terminal sorting domain containing protein [Flavipsychrobacter sp.]|nr:Por secretion system C-terminal sorting domain containing protein [Flavipsychrobacter sp.]